VKGRETAVKKMEENKKINGGKNETVGKNFGCSFAFSIVGFGLSGG
jgi:hypothetical protein